MDFYVFEEKGLPRHTSCKCQKNHQKLINEPKVNIKDIPTVIFTVQHLICFRVLIVLSLSVLNLIFSYFLLDIQISEILQEISINAYKTRSSPYAYLCPKNIGPTSRFTSYPELMKSVRQNLSLLIYTAPYHHKRHTGFIKL